VVVTEQASHDNRFCRTHNRTRFGVAPMRYPTYLTLVDLTTLSIASLLAAVAVAATAAPNSDSPLREKMTARNLVAKESYLQQLEARIQRVTEFAEFQPDAPPLWAAVQRTISDLLLAEWRAGHLMGTREFDAYQVKCDRTTMTQTDIDNGKLVCLVLIATVRPAEFSLIRISHWTAGHKMTP
jgi:phage tail sheath protein FI